MADLFYEKYGYEPAYTVEAPGRTELGGNHTDHQHGLVLASPVHLFMRAQVGTEGPDDVIRVYSEGYGDFSVAVGDTGPRGSEYGTPESIVRGVAAAFAREGLKGFDAYITSEVPAGSGLSSSAALEILIGRICCRLTGAKRTGTELAILGQQVENTYFGKPCGLMDQMACAADGIIAIDFRNPAAPEVREISCDVHALGYDIYVVKCGAGHEDMTGDYAAITEELRAVCEVFGERYLRDVPEEVFRQRLPEVRAACGDRAALRAMHVYAEDRRVPAMADALEHGDIDGYLALVRESGRSSYELLQNITPEGSVRHQDMAVALAAAEMVLGGRGAVRVHGGGFAGTIQAYVPPDMEEKFVTELERLLGSGCCIRLT